MNKANVIATLNSLPEIYKTEELIEKLLSIEKVEKGQQDIMEGKTIPFEEVKKEFLALKRQIDDLLPVDLKEKNFRLWIPKKKQEDYTRKKIDERVWC